MRIAYGTDSGIAPHGVNARQFPYYVRYGMTPMQAIQSATGGRRELIRWEDRVGAVEPGLLADLIAVDGDPTDDVIDARAGALRDEGRARSLKGAGVRGS